MKNVLMVILSAALLFGPVCWAQETANIEKTEETAQVLKPQQRKVVRAKQKAQRLAWAKNHPQKIKAMKKHRHQKRAKNAKSKGKAKSEEAK